MKHFLSLSEYIAIIKEFLTPDDIQEKIEDINTEQLYNQGFRNLILDVDNTILSYQQKEISLQKLQWIEGAKSQGFNCFLISNNSSKRRIQKVCTQLDLPGIYFALKPFTFGTKDFAQMHNIKLEKSVIVGDQITRDVIMGRWLKMHTILVTPLDVTNSVFKALQRQVELKILSYLK